LAEPVVPTVRKTFSEYARESKDTDVEPSDDDEDEWDEKNDVNHSIRSGFFPFF
jgi:hypothetical protein